MSRYSIMSKAGRVLGVAALTPLLISGLAAPKTLALGNSQGSHYSGTIVLDRGYRSTTYTSTFRAGTDFGCAIVKVSGEIWAYYTKTKDATTGAVYRSLVNPYVRNPHMSVSFYNSCTPASMQAKAMTKVQITETIYYNTCSPSGFSISASGGSGWSVGTAVTFKCGKELAWTDTDVSTQKTSIYAPALNTGVEIDWKATRMTSGASTPVSICTNIDTYGNSWINNSRAAIGSHTFTPCLTV